MRRASPIGFKLNGFIRVRRRNWTYMHIRLQSLDFVTCSNSLGYRHSTTSWSLCRTWWWSCSYSFYPFVVARDELLLVDHDMCDNLLTSSSTMSRFVDISFLPYSGLGSRVLILGTMTLEWMMTSELNAKEKWVSPVDSCLVGWFTHRTLGS